MSKIQKSVVAFRSFPTDREQWIGPSEVREADLDDIKLMAAWFDGDNPDLKTSYKLPHHRASNHLVSWNGLIAAMGALLGARGGVDIPDADRRGVYNHLASHYTEDFNADPPEFVTKATLMKAGARMARSRLKRFLAAIETLHGIAKELGWEAEVAKSRIDAPAEELAKLFKLGDDLKIIEDFGVSEVKTALDADAQIEKTHIYWPADLNE